MSTKQTVAQKAKLDKTMKSWAKHCGALRMPKPGDAGYKAFWAE